MWILIPVLAAGWLIGTSIVRIHHIEAISALSPQAIATDPSSPTGSVHGLRRMIPPDRAIESTRWIMETQTMIHQGPWRLRHFDLDNAPDGRAVRTPSAYRWWLGGLAWIDHHLSDRSYGQAVAHAALYADPLLHLLLLISVPAFVATGFGPLPAAVAAVALVGFFPLAGSFQAGLPTDLGLRLSCLLWSVLLLASGLHCLRKSSGRTEYDPAATPNRKARRLFLTAGLFGGIGLWIDPTTHLLALAGLGIGGFLAAWRRHRRAEGSAYEEALITPWRAWALGGALATGTAYLLERFPGELSLLPTDGVHWIHAVAWLALGEMLKRADDWGRAGKWPRDTVGIGLTAAGGAVLIGAVFLIVRHSAMPPFTGDLFSWRLTLLPGGPVAESVRTWWQRDGLSPMLRATLLPLLILVPALWMISRDRSSDNRRLVFVLLMGPLVPLIGLAGVRLQAWNAVDVLLLVILIVGVAPGRLPERGRGRRLGATAILTALLCAPGLILLSPPGGHARPADLSPTEAESLIERDLAHWLARKETAEAPIVLAPPHLTASLAWFGSIRGLGTLHPENDDGVAAAIRIASATSNLESRALLEQRRVTHVVVPSWDPGLADYARIGSGVPGGTFVALLNRWELPPWIRPLVYPMPQIPGWDSQRVTVFAVVDEQDPADAISRLAEYFLEMGEIERAAGFREALENFPASLGALAALAQIAMARGDSEAFASVMEWVVPYTEGGASRSLPWDRRVSLAIVLTQGKERELAREQVATCLNTVTLEKLQSLTPSSLYRFQLLGKMFGLEIADPNLRARARTMVAPELRERL